jgi:preprotein translocase subunit SecD
VAPPRGQRTTTAARPGRALIALLALIIVMLAGILGANAFTPSKWHHSFKVQLGLDLSSGTQVTLSAETLTGKQPSQQEMNQAKAIILNRVNGAGFTGAEVQLQGSNDIVVTVPGKGSSQVESLVGATALLFMRQVLVEAAPDATTTSSSSSTTTTPSTGSTTKPKVGASPTATPTTGSSSSSTPKAAGDPGSAATTGLRGMDAGARVLDTAKPKASTSPTPSTSSTAKATTTPTPTPTTSTPATSTDISGDTSAVKPAVLKLFNKVNCNNKNWKSQIGYTPAQYDQPDAQIVSCSSASGAEGLGTLKYVLGPAIVPGTDITSAQAGVPNSQTSLSSKWQVNFTLNGKGAKLFGDATAAIASKYYSDGAATSVLDQVAVVLDGQTVSAPDITEAIPGGQGQITYFPEAEAQQLANELSYGSLPINFTSQDVEAVSAQLGHNQLVWGLVAAGIGLGLVVVYSFLYYRGLGLVSVSSLVIASLLAYFSVVLLSKYASQGFSLSLASIAGLIVAIGITADSFVVFFERLRDEVRDGRSLRPAVESGWKRARRTILVSDTVSFLCALLLWYFSISDVKGFAFTLGLTTLIDIIVVFLFTKPMVTLLARTKFFSSGRPMSGLDPTRLGARTPWRSSVTRARTTRAKEA